MQKFLILFFIGFSVTFLLLIIQNAPSYNILSPLSGAHWDIRSIDTMKNSRDIAREKLADPSFDEIIDQQMADIANTGANYVAIGTPYDEEFLPFLKRWVKSARKHKLHVWFRGNFSGWEQWFGYAKIDRATHIAKVEDFILKNGEIFEDGDIFSSCPECENGEDFQYGNAQALVAYRAFLIEEYLTTKISFETIGKKVESNYYSMNGDVAKAVMDKETTAALDGLVVVDHYVADPKVLSDDLRALARQSGGQVVLGEFGAPVPDIHGKMTEKEQTEWLEKSLEYLSNIPEVRGLNYWVNLGGTTALWLPDRQERSGVSVLKRYYSQ